MGGRKGDVANTKYKKYSADRTQKDNSFSEINMPRILANHGGAAGWEDNAMKLVKSGPRGH